MEKYEKIVTGFIIAMFIGILVIFNIDISGHEMKFMDNKIVIKSESILIEDIVNVELLDDVFIGNKIGGTSTFTYNRGTYSLGDGLKGKVYVYNKSKPYIRITTKDKIVIYNDKESEQTQEKYHKLISLCKMDPNQVSSNIIPKNSKYEEKSGISKYVTSLICILPLIGVGLYAFNKKTPMHFWAGTTVKPEEISDIKKYNRANGTMWIVYGLSFLLLPTLSNIFGEMAVTAMYMFGFVVFIFCYKCIYNKYKVK